MALAISNKRVARALVALAVLFAGGSEAAAEPPLPNEPNFWERMGALRHLEIRDALVHAQELYRQASVPVQTESDLRLREALLNDARGMLHYALRLEPEDMRALATLALVEEAFGHTERARELYQRVFDRQDESLLPDQACARYGMLEARLDHVERALEILVRCVRQEESLGVFQPRAVISLSLLYASYGRMEEAIQVLERRIEMHPGAPLVDMTLVALYDKDGQINRAVALFKELTRTRQYRLFNLLDQMMGDVPMVPPEERHYLSALILELHGALPEAREEWHHYIRSGSRAVFTQRAREHVRAIDTLLDQPRRSRSLP